MSDTKPVEKALVRYSYQAENDDELSLSEGEIVIVLDKELEDSGWYKGELNGKVGVFPDNFVELIKEEPVPDKAPRPAIPPTPQPKAPKKPPPPAQPPAPKITPKLPDKAPVAEHPKPEPVKEEKPAPMQPAILSKKPFHPPPPLSKKPHKPVDTPQHVKEDKDEKSKIDFEHVEPAADKLTHLTASRPRGPAKRPPSQVFFQNPKHRTKYVTTNIFKEEERNGDVKDSHWLKDDKLSSSHAHVPATVVEKKVEHVHPKEKSHPLPTRPPAETSQATANLQSAIEDLRKEMLDLKTHTVSKTAFNELKSENERLKQDLDTMKTTYSRRLKDIMLEVDEEKKIRLSTQVEMERIRKLVAESHV